MTVLTFENIFFTSFVSYDSNNSFSITLFSFNLKPSSVILGSMFKALVSRKYLYRKAILVNFSINGFISFLICY